MIDRNETTNALPNEEFIIIRNIGVNPFKNQEFDGDLDIIAIPKEIIPYCNINNTNWEKAINKIYSFFRCHQFQLPRNTIQSLFYVISDSVDAPKEIISKTLLILDYALSLSTQNDGHEFSQAETSILYKYFPIKNAINIFSSMIRLDPKCVKFFVNCFLNEDNRNCFDTEISMLLMHNYSNDRIPLLNLILNISTANKVVPNYPDIFRILIETTQKMKPDEQILSFQIMGNFCKGRKNFISMILNNQNISKLYSHVVEDDRLLEASFGLAVKVAGISSCPLDFFRKSKIIYPINFAIQNRREKSLLVILDAFYDLLNDDSDAVSYFIKKKLYDNLIELYSKVSFPVWKGVICAVCEAVRSASNDQIMYMLKKNLLFLIAETSQSESSEESDLGCSITSAMKSIYLVAYEKYRYNRSKILSSEVRASIIEFAYLESDGYFPITSFIQEVDKLYSS